ncbi:MAG TPA: hypothetical protein VHR42_08550 [Clostridia bacterium]|nr:hypothetical protein [Clostridia bacterium]
MKRPFLSRALYGLVLIVIGVGILGHMANFWDLGYLARGWWALLLIVPGLAGIISSGLQFWNCFLVIFGGWLYIRAHGWLGNNSFPWLLGIALIAFGIWTITGGGRNGKFEEDYRSNTQNGTNGKDGRHSWRYSSSEHVNQDSDDFPEYSSVFSGYRVANKCKAFRGGKASSVFGRLTLDLREIEITGRAVLEVASVFGNLEILLPPGVPVKSNVVPVFGIYRNNSAEPHSGPENSGLEIKGSAVFGTIDIY